MADEIDFHSSTWRAVKKFCEAEIAAARTRLEQVGLEQSKTDALRGEIGAMRAVLAQDQSNQPVIHQGPGNITQR